MRSSRYEKTPGVRNHLSHVPTESVDQLVLFGEQVVDLLRLFADAGKRASRARRVVDCAGVMSLLEFNQLLADGDVHPRSFRWIGSASCTFSDLIAIALWKDSSLA